jgi:hypothetical protein
MPDPVGHSARGLVVALALVLAAVPLVAYHQFLSSDALLYSYDHAQLQLPRYVILCDALQRHGEFPLWQELLYAGAPFHANPEVPSFYPPVLALALFLPPLLVMNLVIVLHLMAAAVGMHLLVVRLWRRVGGRAADGAVGGFAAGCCFGFSLTTRLDHFNLVSYGAAHALIPWILLAFESVTGGPRPRRAAAALGLLLAAQVATGGLYVYAYTALGLVLWFAVEGLLGGPAPRARALRWLPVAGAVAGVLVAARMLPVPAWVATTNRTGPLPIEQARGVTLGGHGSFAWSSVWSTLVYYTGHGLGLALLALALTQLRCRVVRTALGIALLGFCVALGGVGHQALHELVPPFDRVRNAIRAWTLANAFLPLAAGLGLAGVLAAARRDRAADRAGDRAGDRPGLAHAVALALLLGVLPLWLDTGRHQASLDAPDSRADVLARYVHWPRAAGLAGDAWRAAQEDLRSIAARNEQFVSTALGVEVVGGMLGNIWPQRLNRHAFLLPGSTVSPFERRKRLGILSVRPLVTSSAEPGGPADGAPDAELFPPGIDGATVQLNGHARPRAVLPAGVAGVFGDVDDTALYALLDSPPFEPTRHAAVVFGPDDPPEDAELAALDAFLVVDGGAPLAPALRARLQALRARGTPSAAVTLPLTDDDGRALALLARRLDATGRQPVPGTLDRASPGRSRVRVPEATPEGGAGARPAWLVVSEAWAGYDGWRLTVGAEGGPSRAATPRRADGVVSAVLLRAGEQELGARYAPADARAGLVLAGAGLLAALVLLCWPARRPTPAPTPAPEPAPTPASEPRRAPPAGP